MATIKVCFPITKELDLIASVRLSNAGMLVQWCWNTVYIVLPSSIPIPVSSVFSLLSFLALDFQLRRDPVRNFQSWSSASSYSSKY